MSTSIEHLSRPEKAEITIQIRNNLVARKDKGPEEKALDDLIPQCDAMAASLQSSVGGKSDAGSVEVASRAERRAAHSAVRREYRKIQGFLSTAVTHNSGEKADAIQEVYDDACPGGAAILDKRIKAVNTHARETVRSLRTDAHQVVLVSIGFPFSWLDGLEQAVIKSEAMVGAVGQAKLDGAQHAARGRDAEDDWPDLMRQLQGALRGRVGKGDLEKELENETLIHPLTEALAGARARAKTRATLRAKELAEKQKEEEAKRAAEANAKLLGPPANGKAPQSPPVTETTPVVK